MIELRIVVALDWEALGHLVGVAVDQRMTAIAVWRHVGGIDLAIAVRVDDGRLDFGGLISDNLFGCLSCGDFFTTTLGNTGTAVGAASAGAASFFVAEAIKNILVHATHNEGDVAGLLVDAASASTSTGTEPLEGRTLVGEAGRDEQLVGHLLVVVLGIRHCGTQDFLDVL